MLRRSSRTASAAPLQTASHQDRATLYCVLVALCGFGVLAFQIANDRGRPDWAAILVFAGLSLLVQRSSFALSSEAVHSPAGVIDIAAVLALGPAAGASAAALAGLSHLLVSALQRGRWNRHDLLEIPAFNAGLKAGIALLGGGVFQAMAGPLPVDGGPFPAQSLGVGTLAAVLVLSVLWFTLDYLGWGMLNYLEGGKAQLAAFLDRAIPDALLVELLPLPSSLLVALVYTQLHWAAFALLAVGIISVAVLAERWAGARNELMQRVAELGAIEQVGRAIAQAELDVDGLYRLLYEHARRIVDTSVFQLGLFEGEDYVIKLWIRDGQPVPPQSFRLTPGVGLVNWQRTSKEPILVRDFQQEMDSLPARPAYASEAPPRSALFVPLLVGDAAIGILSIQSFRPNAYGPSDLRLLSAMANETAVAVQKARLYERERKRVRQLQTIGQIGRQVSAYLDLDELFRRAVHLVRENFGYYHVGIYTTDRERQTVIFQTSSSAGEHEVALDVAWGEGLIGWVAAHGQALLVNDVAKEPRYLADDALDETRSELAVPLRLEEDLVGILDVQSDQANAFGPDDLFILETVGDQIAVAIQEAWLYEAERQQAWFSTALLQVADTTRQLSDMDAVLSNIVRLTSLLVGVDRCAVLLWDQDTETFLPEQSHGLSPEVHEAFSRMELPPGALPALDLMRFEKRHILVDAELDHALVPVELARTLGICEMVLLPLLAQGELVGAMWVDCTAAEPAAGRRNHRAEMPTSASVSRAHAGHRYDERMIELLTGIANQAAMVIQSARLLQSQQEEAYVSMALLQAAEAVSRSNDLREILGTIVRITPTLAGVKWCAIFLWDAGSSSFWPFHQYGLPEKLLSTFWQLRLRQEQGLAQSILTSKSFLLPPEEATALFMAVEETGRTADLAGDASILVLPLTTKGGVVGVMMVDSAPSTRYSTKRPTNILVGIANQAAIAIENDRLLQEATEQERMKRELDVARHIQTSFLPEYCPRIAGWELATVWRSAREVSGDFYDFIPLPPRWGADGQQVIRSGVVIADVADKGVPAALFMALSRTLVRTMAMDGRVPDEAVGRANDLILADSQSGLFVTLFYAILESNSGEVEYVSAGHLPALLIRAGDDPSQTEELRTDGIAMGVLPGFEYTRAGSRLQVGDLLVLYTDGVTEAQNTRQEMFGKARLIETIWANRTQSAAELAQTIDNVVAHFVGDAPQFDDFTLVIAKHVACRCQDDQ